jgi:hypothetical protein
MEWMMTAEILERVKSANLKLQTFLHGAEEALAGRRIFGVDELHTAQEPVSEIGALLSEATRLRATSSELDHELALYSQNLEATQTALDRVRVVLLARCGSLEAQRAHLSAVSMWSSAFTQTQSATNTEAIGSPHADRYERHASGL